MDRSERIVEFRNIIASVTGVATVATVFFVTVVTRGDQPHDSRDENMVYDQGWNDLARRCRDRVLANHMSWLP